MLKKVRKAGIGGRFSVRADTVGNGNRDHWRIVARNDNDAQTVLESLVEHNEEMKNGKWQIRKSLELRARYNIRNKPLRLIQRLFGRTNTVKRFHDGIFDNALNIQPVWVHRRQSGSRELLQKYVVVRQ